ncbi:MAG: glycogen debranching N-terminal domain-containing protein [Dermabacter sp.]|nr:glycogen debranching N-terminal domain-containing protein [Dermabacter sp.]
MTLHQPFVHDLVGVFAAPVQAWSTPAGTMRGEGAEGIFLADDRLVSAYAVAVRGRSLIEDGGAALPAGELSPIGTFPDGATTVRFVDVVSLEGLPVDPVVRLERSRSASITGVSETLTLTSAADHPVRVELEVRFTLDALPMAAVKDPQLSPRLAIAPPVPTVEGAAARWSWRAATSASLEVGGVGASLRQDSTEASLHQDSARASLRLDDAPASAHPTRAHPAAPLVATFRATLAPNSSATWQWRLSARDTESPFVGVDEPPLGLAVGHGAVIEDDGGDEQAAVGRLLHQSLADLSSLRLARRAHPDQAFLAAGAPWFFTLFGRDSLIAAHLLAPLDHDLAVRTVRTLATQQGERTDTETAEQPGKILHEVRAVGMDMGSSYLPPVYYGTIDATCLWVHLVSEVSARGADVSELAGNVARAAIWLLEHADADGDFFLEYIDESGHGLANQGWKDSGDSVRRADGSIAPGPIALSEVQGYAYEACCEAASLLRQWGHPEAGELAPRLEERAAQIREAFRSQFWVSDERGPYIALALDGDKRPVDAVASNMGHVLGTGILDADEERIVIDRLLDPTMFSGYGIRTLSTDNGAYWPQRYHGGSVWTHDTAFILRQALRAGFVEEARVLARGLLRAARGFDERLPELFAGDAASEVFPPLPYPASCRPQAWAAASAVPVALALGHLSETVSPA